MSTNAIKNIAIVGAGGRIGSFICKALLEKKRFNVSAITRNESTNSLPAGVNIKKVDYNSKESIASALKGEDVLIITMAVTAPQDQQSKLIEAAAEANVPFVIPNEWGYDITIDPTAANETFLGPRALGIRQKIAELGKSAFIAMSCGFWYQFSLAGGTERFGFNFKNKTLTLLDDGNTKLDVSTYPQVGRAVASFLCLKVKPDGPNDKSPTISQFSNKSVNFHSFNLSQRDMLNAVLKATGDKESDWTITHEESKERYMAGVKKMQGGDMKGFVQLMYTRMMYKDEPGNMEKRGVIQNTMLGLPKEDLVAETKIAVEWAAEGKDY